MVRLSDPNKELAAQLIAEGRLEYGEIAKKVGVERTSLHRWRKEEKFAARVNRLREEFLSAAEDRALARKDYRLSVLNAKHNELLTLIEQRAADPSLAEIPGGATGLLVKQYKVSGENVVAEYVYDSAVTRDLLKVQEQAAKELGQLVDKKELTGKDGVPLLPEIAGQMTLEQIDARLQAILGPGIPAGKVKPRAKARSRKTSPRARSGNRVRTAQK